MKRIAAVLFALSVLPGVAFAQAGSMEMMKKMDTNNDGKISREEAKKAGMKDADFKKLDTGGDGSISIEEWQKGQPIILG